MARRKRTPEEEARRTKIRELLQASNVGSMEDIQNLFKETIAEFMETGLDADCGRYIAVAILICVNASKISSLNSARFRQKVCSHLCIYFAEIVPNEFPRTTRHTTAGIPAEKNKRQNCSETTLLIAILAF